MLRPNASAPEVRAEPVVDAISATPDASSADLPAATPPPDAAAPTTADAQAVKAPEKPQDRPPRLGGPGKTHRETKEEKDSGFVELKHKKDDKPRPEEDGDFIVLPKSKKH